MQCGLFIDKSSEMKKRGGRTTGIGWTPVDRRSGKGVTNRTEG